jgi:predicted transcriptional regulator
MERKVKQTISNRAAVYGPQTHKSFVGALNAFFTDECPQLGGDLSRRALVKAIEAMVRRFFPETSHLKAGQMPWITIHKDEKGSYGKTIDKSELVSVNLNLVPDSDARERAEGKKLRELKKDAVARLCKEAYEQEGCLTQAEIAIMLKISAPTVGKYIAEWETAHGECLPRRGTIHDMGPTLTHKKIIIEKLFVEKKSVQQTSRETFHSFQAIHRYICSFKKVLLCYRKGLSKEEICVAAGHSARLIQQYLDLIEEFEQRGLDLQKIAAFDARIESHYEQHPVNQPLPSEIS